MATFTESKFRVLGGVDGKQFKFIDGLLEVGGPTDEDFGSDPGSDGGNDAGLPCELFGLNQVVGAFPFFDDDGAFVVPVASPDRKRLLFQSENELFEPNIAGVPFTVIGVE